jgi:hypothetical protein
MLSSGAAAAARQSDYQSHFYGRTGRFAAVRAANRALERLCD